MVLKLTTLQGSPESCSEAMTVTVKWIRVSSIQEVASSKGTGVPHSKIKKCNLTIGNLKEK